MFADIGMNVIPFDFTSDKFYLESVLEYGGSPFERSWFLRFSVIKCSIELIPGK
jgi:hypothetical protein